MHSNFSETISAAALIDRALPKENNFVLQLSGEQTRYNKWSWINLDNRNVQYTFFKNLKQIFQLSKNVNLDFCNPMSQVLPSESLQFILREYVIWIQLLCCI